MKKQGIYFLLLLAFSFALTACNEEPKEVLPPGGNQGVIIVDNDTSDYSDININYRLDENALAALNESDIASMFSNMTYEGLYRDYQRTTNLTHDMYAGYVANNKPAFNPSSPSYSYTDGWSGLRWEFFYNERTAQEYAPLLKIFYFKDNAERTKYKNAFYITRIYWAFLASMTTDTYGDIPLSAYVRGLLPDEPEKVKYDTQEECYDIIFRMLKQAVDSIVPNACSFKLDGTTGNGAPIDRCYGGDEEKWLRFANTLRLRLALRISNIAPERARREGEAAITNKWGLMKSDADRMRTVPKNAPVSEGGEDEGGSENVIAMCCMMYNGDMVMGKDLELAYKNQSVGGADNYYLVTTTTVDDMFDFDWSYVDDNRIEDLDNPDPATWQHSMIDPRCKVCWFRPTPNSELQSTGEEFKYADYAGCEQADWRVTHDASVEFLSMAATDKTTKALNPKKYFSTSRESVWLGYAETQFLLAEAALRGWAGVADTPEGYYRAGIQASMDYFQISKAEAKSYIDGLMIYQDGQENPFATNNRELALEQIITQKWLAMFPNGNEAWAEFRRTDYPRLRLPLHNLDLFEGYFIKRVRYPEAALNNVNRPEVGQGDRVWWDVENTMDGAGAHVESNNFR